MAADVVKSFDQWPYRRIELDLLTDEIRKAKLHLRLAISANAATQAVADLQVILRLYQTQAAVARIRHDRQTDDPYYLNEQAYYDETDAYVAQETQAFYAVMLGSRFRSDLEVQYGSLIFRKAQNLKEIVQPAIVDDLAEENRLASLYTQKMSGAAIELNGQTYTLAQMEPMMQSADRLIRQQAHAAHAAWLQAQSSSLDQLFDRLVAIRDRIGKKMGFASFTEVGYRRMGRFDYQRGQVEALRQAVIRYIVPLTREIRRLQRRRLGLEQLFYYDLPCLFPAGNPRLLPSADQLPELAASALSQLTGQSPAYLQMMADGGYLDLATRPNKVNGGYCSTVMNAGMPFILMNASGIGRDVSVLFHEAGHAYASLRGLNDMTLVEYHQPTLETCEIHSTALEYLIYPHLEPFFGPDTENFTLMHMTEALLFIPYGCMVDEFQHIIYDQPRLSPEQRHQVWLDLERTYMPDLDYAGEPFFSKGGAWQKKEHIFTSPFYYIDYVIAQISALDIWQISRKSPKKAWRQYDRLCGLGGRNTCLNLLHQAEMASPFDLGTIKRVAYAACDFLNL